jgi:hypothetical protein
MAFVRKCHDSLIQKTAEQLNHNRPTHLDEAAICKTRHYGMNTDNKL